MSGIAKQCLMFGIGLIMSVCLTNTTAFSVQFEDCGSTGVKVSNVDITPCSADPCPIYPGKKSAVAISFEATATADNITTKAYGYVAGVRVPYPLPQPDACTKSNITCPLKPNGNYVYDLALPVPKGLPKVDVIVELDMMVDDKKILCIQFEVIVTPTKDNWQHIEAFENDVNLA